ncbi:hypothetical protein [Escherichia coli]|uniref:hypothetical protein n=1 Tax=Escherichia coli TaxID=562 RepID=UPI0039A69934
MKGNCADLHLGGVVKLPGLTASSWATRPLPRSRTGQGITSPVTPTRAKRPPPPCKAGFGGLSDDTTAGTTAAWRLQIVVWQNMSFQSNHPE